MTRTIFKVPEIWVATFAVESERDATQTIAAVNEAYRRVVQGDSFYLPDGIDVVSVSDVRAFQGVRPHDEWGVTSMENLFA